MEQQFESDYIPTEQTPDTVLFENTHVRDKNFWREFFTYFNFMKPLSIACSIFLWTFFLINLILFVPLGHGSWLLAILPPVCTLLVLLLTVSNIKISCKREQETGNGTQITYTMQIYDTMVRLKSSLGHDFVLEFATVKRVVQTKHYLMLQTPTKQCYPIKKDGFTKGSYEELCAFLRAKGYKVITK